jgi:hypothetical protein
MELQNKHLTERIIASAIRVHKELRDSRFKHA